MKLTHAIIALTAASAMPTAWAQEAEEAVFTGKGTPYAIEINADLRPAELGATAYPHAAASRRMNGDCAVKYDIAPDGTPQEVEVLRCSSGFFETEARRIAASAQYKSGAAKDAVMQIKWTIAQNPGAINIASLR